MVGIDTDSRGRHLWLFVLGMATTLTATGMAAGLLGKSLLFAAPWIRWVAGLAFIAAGLSYMGIVSLSRACKISVQLDAEPESVGENEAIRSAVSYTHLDVYKRQLQERFTSIKSIWTTAMLT